MSYTIVQYVVSVMFGVGMMSGIAQIYQTFKEQGEIEAKLKQESNDLVIYSLNKAREEQMLNNARFGIAIGVPTYARQLDSVIGTDLINTEEMR